MNRRVQLAILLAVALLVLFALWPEPTAGDAPIVTRVDAASFVPLRDVGSLSGTNVNPRRPALSRKAGNGLIGGSGSDGPLGNPIQGRPNDTHIASGRASASTPRSAPEMAPSATAPVPADKAAPRFGLGDTQGRTEASTAATNVAECREWALGCGRYPALATVGASSPSASATPVRTASALPASMTGIMSRKGGLNYDGILPSRDTARWRPPSGAPASRAGFTEPSAGITGVASWFASPIGVSAAGPALRTPGWRGSVISVTGPAGSALTRLGDFCQCFAGMANERAIDLDTPVFVRVCGPLSKGLCRVTIEREP